MCQCVEWSPAGQLSGAFGQQSTSADFPPSSPGQVVEQPVALGGPRSSHGWRPPSTQNVFFPVNHTSRQVNLQGRKGDTLYPERNSGNVLGPFAGPAPWEQERHRWENATGTREHCRDSPGIAASSCEVFTITSLVEP